MSSVELRIASRERTSEQAREKKRGGGREGESKRKWEGGRGLKIFRHPRRDE